MSSERTVQPVMLTLGGHLSFYDTQKRSHLMLSLTQPISLSELLAQLGIPVSEVDLVAVNGEQSNLAEAWITPGDKVALYPADGRGPGQLIGSSALENFNTWRNNEINHPSV